MILDFILKNTPLLYLTQSLWRDEAFSVLTSEGSILSFIGKLNFEPPVYYVLLHFWIKLFGTSEIAVRSLSLVSFLLATCIVVFWAEHVFKKHWIAYLTPFLFFFNPMLLYYAFEVRAYGVLMFFATLSLYAYSTKRYKLLAVANIFAFYTHSFALFIPLVQLLHYGITHLTTKHFFTLKHLVKDHFLRSFIIWTLAISPWMVILLQEFAKSRQGWYFPVDLQLVLSVLGNMFTSYDGTPGNHWQYTRLLSLFLLPVLLFNLKDKKNRIETTYLNMAIFVPLIIVIGVSFIKPLFVNRYLIFVTIAQIMAISYTIYTIKHKYAQILLAAVFIILTAGINLYLPAKKPKLDIRSTLYEANAIRTNKDILLVTSPLIFFEAQYYTRDRSRVYLYNPDNVAFPWYVGDSAFDKKQMTTQLPEYPTRAVVVGMDQSISIQYRLPPQSSFSKHTANKPAPKK
jgi:mannosyltransferase